MNSLNVMKPPTLLNSSKVYSYQIMPLLWNISTNDNITTRARATMEDFNMTLALVQAIVAWILLLITTWTGLLITIAFLIPEQTNRAETSLRNSTRRCFLTGLPIAVLMVVGVLLLSAGPGALKFLGVLLLGFAGLILTIGAAGMAQIIGMRSDLESEKPSFPILLRGSLALSLAIGFPLIGWVIFAPIALIFAMGAGVAAIIPVRRSVYTPPNSPPTSPEFDFSNRQGAI